MLVNGLPPDAAVWRKEAEWTRQDELLAALIETTDHWGRQAAVDQGHKSRQLGKPLRIDRPVEDAPKTPEETAKRDPRKIAAFFARNFG